MWTKNIDIHPAPRTRRSGYTLVEMLISVVLTLTLMYGVAQIFSMVGTSVNDSRALLGIGDRLRATKARLELDLDGVTSRMTPPAKPDNNEGYFELIEGPVGPKVSIETRAINTDEAGNPQFDSTAIDYDDILMFTTRTTSNEPFIGRAGQNNTVESRFAEVAWFVRGRTLYRRVKIIKPDYPEANLLCQNLYGSTLFPNNGSFNLANWSSVDCSGGVLSGVADQNELAFENQFDLSVRFKGDIASPDAGTWGWVPNSLSDLTKRENRMYHAPILPITVTSYFEDRFPFSIHDTVQWRVLGLPTIGETSNLNWMFYQWSRFNSIGGPELPVLIAWNPPGTLGTRTLSGNTADLNAANQEVDFWSAPYPYDELDPITGNITEQTLQTALENLVGTVESRDHQRVGEDVILNNVIGFDVKVWDPDAPVLSYDMGTADPSDDVILRPGDPGYPRNGSGVNFNSLASGYAIVDYGAFVDIGYGDYLTMPNNKACVFADAPESKAGFPTAVYVYDTWSTHYESDGIDQQGDGAYDLAINGLDDDPDGAGVETANNLVDDAAELDTMPPYPVPLTAIQIKIRVFEPDSRQIREVTIVHKF